MKTTLIHDDGQVVTHIGPGLGDYATICGIATDGDANSAEVAAVQKKSVDCPGCLTIWQICRHHPGTGFRKLK